MMTGSISVLNHNGDEVVVEWDAKDEESVKKGEAEFARLKKEGYEFFKAETVKGPRVKEFDKSLGKLLAMPGVKSDADKATGKRPKATAGGPKEMAAIL